jgi:very-short-patch-repair endonuclease
MPKRASYDISQLDDLRAQQHQVITRAQADACGIPSSTMDDWIRNGSRWQVLLPGVYLTVTGTPIQDQRETAALLYAGDGSLITGPCAVRRHQLACPGGNTIDVLVGMKTQRRSTGFVRLRRTKRMPESLSAGPIRFAGPARAVADAARDMNKFDDVRSVLYGAVQNRVCSAADLAAELREGPTQGCSPARSVIGELATGIRSRAENDLRLLVKRGKLPEPAFNAKLFTLDGEFVAMVDGWWEEAGVAAEVDSRAYHTDPKAQEKDRNRHDRLIAHGVFPLHFSPRRIKSEGKDILGEIDAAIKHGRKRPRLPLIALGPDEKWDTTHADKATAMRQALAQGMEDSAVISQSGGAGTGSGGAGTGSAGAGTAARTLAGAIA